MWTRLLQLVRELLYGVLGDPVRLEVELYQWEKEHTDLKLRLPEGEDDGTE